MIAPLLPAPRSIHLPDSIFPSSPIRPLAPSMAKSKSLPTWSAPYWMKSTNRSSRSRVWPRRLNPSRPTKRNRYKAWTRRSWLSRPGWANQPVSGLVSLIIVFFLNDSFTKDPSLVLSIAIDIVLYAFHYDWQHDCNVNANTIFASLFLVLPGFLERKW